ncbi:MAG TPA: hypothetical protein VFP84_15950, partial [Kofleriaceae bacterium]|nr:hypothetical protein [Kofleriaceae bacterium]
MPAPQRGRLGAAHAARQVGERIGGRRVEQERRRGLLEVAAERDRGRERVRARAQRQDAVAVDLLEANRERAAGRGDHVRQEEAGLLVGDHEARARGQRGE